MSVTFVISAIVILTLDQVITQISLIAIHIMVYMLIDLYEIPMLLKAS